MSEYEFSEEENVVIGKLNKHMLLASIMLALSGLIAFILGLTDSSLFDVYSGITVFCIGLSLYFPIDNFKRIVTTTSQDIKELLTGFSELDRGWLLVNIITAIYMLMKVIRIFVDF